MNPHVTIRWMSASVLALLGAACGASNVEGPASTTTTTSAPVDMPASVAPTQSMSQTAAVVVLGDDAASQIASARCVHEDACYNVGAGKEFSSFDACVGDVRSVHRQRLTGQLCAHGVDPYALSQCIDDVRNQQCGQGTPGTCASVRLCR